MRRVVATALVAIMFPMLAACAGRAPSQPSPLSPVTSIAAPNYTVRHMCQALIDFLEDEFANANGLQINTVHDLDSSMKGSRNCQAVSSSREYVGFVRFQPVDGELGPTVGREKYEKVDGYSADMWISDDGRTAAVGFFTSSGGWGGSLDINLGSDNSPMRDRGITDAQKDAAAEFIIRLLRESRN